jgi:hypothetical protein
MTALGSKLTAKISFWRAKELSDAHWLNVNKDTKEDLNKNSILILYLFLVV